MDSTGIHCSLSVQLLGDFALHQGETPIPLPPSTASRRLLAYLLLYRKPVSRSTLSARLWPDIPEDKARHTLRQAIWQIRQTLPEFLTFTGATCSMATMMTGF